MKYYTLNTFIEKDANKSSIQINSKIPNDDISDINGIYAFGRIDFPQISEIKFLILEKGYDLKDFLNATMLRLSGLLINKKAINIFSKFNLPKHKYYPAYVMDYKESIYEYFWLQTSSERDLISLLNYQKSKFYWKKDIIGIEKEDIEINSLDDMINFKKNLSLNQTIKIKTAVLKNEFLNLNIDLFKIGRFSIDWIVSERLKEALEAAEITGIEFKEATNLVVEN